MAKSLNAQQKRFVEEYLVDYDGSAAYRRAGYEPSNDNACSAAASRLLRQVTVQDAINESLKAQTDKARLTVERIVREIAFIATADIASAFDDEGRLLPVQQIPEPVRRAISSYEEEETLTGMKRKIRFWDKGKALDQAGKYLGMFLERISNPDGTPLAQPILRVVVKDK